MHKDMQCVYLSAQVKHNSLRHHYCHHVLKNVTVLSEDISFPDKVCTSFRDANCFYE